MRQFNASHGRSLKNIIFMTIKHMFTYAHTVCGTGLHMWIWLVGNLKTLI